MTTKKTIVISAVNLNKGGTLTILRDCLSYLSEWNKKQEYRVIAIVFRKELAYYPNIEYIENQWPKKRWINRLWFEYVSMKKISKKIGSIYLWFSLHDTTPNVIADRRAVYCHNPFPFYNWKWIEVLFAPKIVLFALFSKFIYKPNIKKNSFVIVQQQWLKDAFKTLFQLSKDKIIVALPDAPQGNELTDHITSGQMKEYRFVFAASPNSHKNFECLLEAVSLLNRKGFNNFQVDITVQGKENKYARWLHNRYGKLTNINFIGFITRSELFTLYAIADCLVFPSKVETWGLPISEFKAFNKPMLLADLPYAKETAAEADYVSFFDPDEPGKLAEQMKKLIQGDKSFLKKVDKKIIEAPTTESWEELFKILLR